MIRDVIKYSIFISFLAAACLWLLKNEGMALGFFLGTLWGSLNLCFIEALVKEFLLRKNALMIAVLIFVKFPLLYWAGYQLLIQTEADAWYAMGGFSLIFPAAMARALAPLRERAV
jgi:hypothetical protein